MTAVVAGAPGREHAGVAGGIPNAALRPAPGVLGHGPRWVSLRPRPAGIVVPQEKCTPVDLTICG